MKKNKLTQIGIAAIFSLLGLNVSAQTARVQVIHNCADALAEEVDVYLGSTLLIDDFAFRTASAFIDAPAGSLITISIAPSTSTSVTDAIASFDYNLTDGETYILVADGLVNPMGYTPSSATRPFTLSVYAMGRETASMMGNTDVLVHHGSTDAPTVDVVEVGAGAGTIIDNASYGDFAGYLELATADYVLEIRDETGAVTVKSYDAPLAGLSLTNQALVVVASGFLNPSVNSDGPAFGLWVALPTGGDLIPLPESKSRVQVIHNSADAAASQVDVYLGDDLLLDNFAFRTATPFVDVPAGVEITISIAPSTSTSVADAIATFDYQLASGETYIIIANGIVSATGYAPATPFDLDVYAMGRENSSTTGNTDVLVYHGSTDAPTVDVVEVLAGAGTIVDNASYGDFAGYLELATADYIIEVRDETGVTTVASYSSHLATLSLTNQAIVVLASGFLDPTVNSGGASFGLWVALATGGNLVELPTAFLTIEENNLTLPNIYPNPSNQILNINLNDFNAEQIQIISMDGKIVYNGIVNNSTMTLDVSNFDNGLYIIEFSNQNARTQTTLQIIK